MRAENDELDAALRRRGRDGGAGLVDELERLAETKTKTRPTPPREEEDDAGACGNPSVSRVGRVSPRAGIRVGWRGGGLVERGDAGADLDALRADAVEAMKADTCRLARGSFADAFD